MSFIWNSQKGDRTLKKQGFSFADATRVVDDLLRVLEPARMKDGEQRWLTVRVVAFESGPRFLALIYTERESNGKTTIRIISARPASSKESRKIAHTYAN